MGLEQLNRSVDFVADTPPSNANDGELFLDTSLSPPEIKVFDASVGSFVRPQTTQNLDEKVSNAGATQSDISSGVDASTTGTTVATNLDAKVSATGGVNWDAKTPQIDSFTDTITISGSGYLLSVNPGDVFNDVLVTITIDSTTIGSVDIGKNDASVSNVAAGVAPGVIFRFDSSLTIDEAGNSEEVQIYYVLD